MSEGIASPRFARCGLKSREMAMIARLTGAAALALMLWLAPPDSAEAAEDGWITHSTLIGPSKYTDASPHYDYVNPDAPKGGTINSTAIGSFDSFNPFIVQGQPAAGLNYQGGLLWDTLMEKGTDEPSASHPMIAEKWKHTADFGEATYVIDARAKWHDGRPITAEDVQWSLEQLKAHSPTYNKYFGNVSEARIIDERTVTFVFDQKNNRELPLIMGDLPVLPKHWWTANGPDGKPRDFTRSTLEPPLGSGPYRITRFEAGAFVEWERVADYWGADTFTRRGRFNAERRRITYFKEPSAEWEAFKKGGLEDIRIENRAQRWAQLYTFPAVEDGRIVKEVFEETGPYPFQGYFFNTRRQKFADAKVREALSLAFNFEAMNRNLFFGQYTRTDTFFGGTGLAATGLPEGRELEILEGYRGKVPERVFTEAYKPAVYESSRDERKFLRQALGLLKEAGYKRDGTELVGPDGKQFTIEILGFSPTWQRVHAPFMASVRKLGIDISFRVVDTSQYIERLNNFDFDLIVGTASQSSSPGNEQREYWSSSAADQPGSRNFAGIRNPVIDELVEKLIFATDRDELVAHTRALDRVLKHSHYAIPQWHNPAIWNARWDKFGIPRPQPGYIGIDTESWWIDPKKAAALGVSQ